MCFFFFFCKECSRENPHAMLEQGAQERGVRGTVPLGGKSMAQLLNFSFSTPCLANSEMFVIYFHSGVPRCSVP